MNFKNKFSNIEPIKTGGAVHGVKSKKIGLVLNQDTLEQLEDVSKIAEVSRNSVIVHAINLFLTEAGITDSKKEDRHEQR